MAPLPVSRYLLFAAISLGGLAVDMASKQWIFNRLGMPGTSPPLWLAEPVLSLETHLNEGALLGIGQGQRWIFVGMSLVASGCILYWLFVKGAAQDGWLTLALASVSAGIWGNLYDRLGLPGLVWNYPRGRVGQPVYAVRDWIHFKIESVIDWPVFNVADSLLVCGAALLMWQAFRKPAEPVGEAVASPASGACS